jgi:citrate synthase
MDAKTSAKNKTGTLTVGNNNWDMPIYPGTIGPEVVDISKLYAQSGMFTYDPGFTSTASCESKITYIDGDEGILLYRGYPIEQLPSTATSRDLLSASLWGTADSAQKADFDYRVSPSHDGSRSR